ncbi:MAG: DNA topoisomerase IB [Steroidobacteraceae bacterium]
MRNAPGGLVYVSDLRPGIRRQRRSGGKQVHFSYFTAKGQRISDAAVLARIAALAIPPAYEQVWICTNPRGHLQATGRDVRGRKQYRYHAKWRIARDGDKHSRMLQFGTSLSRLRRAVHTDLKLPGLPRDKVLALVVRLLDATQVRIGNAEYARDNQSYGLSTLRDRHARVGRGKALLQFRGKGGAEHDVLVEDPRLARLIRHCQDLPGQQLFQYVDSKGKRHGIDSGHVNSYLQQRMGGQFTAKDFRTWYATLHALQLLGGTPLPEKRSAAVLSRLVNKVVKQVAAGLRNTPAVCRKSYINPQVFAAWEAGQLARTDAAKGKPGAGDLLALLRRTGSIGQARARDVRLRSASRPSP